MHIISDLAVDILAMTYRRHGREAFFRACDELVDGVTAIRKHEERKAQAGLPLGPGTDINWRGVSSPGPAPKAPFARGSSGRRRFLVRWRQTRRRDFHDLRRNLATHMAGEVGIEPHIIEAILNHYSGHRRGVAGVYNRSSYERVVGAALARWNEYVLAIVEGRQSNIFALQRA